ncbi:MAG: ABC transporter permease [Firmicutes bacterium]|nr:ABC transporter permease [Bacillota bacterium]
MRVFKVYAKILWRIKWDLAIYVGIFTALSFAFGVGGGNSRALAFEDTKTPVAWIEEGEPGALTRGLKEALAPYADFREVPESEEDLRDALFYRQVEVILRVPAEFEKDFLAGGEPHIVRTNVPDTTGAYVIDARVDKYLNTARLYRAHMPGIKAAEMAAAVREDLAAEAKVAFLGGHGLNERMQICNEFFNFISYTMVVLMVMGVSSAMIIFTREEICLRNDASPMPPSRVSRQLFTGNLLLAGMVCAVMFLVGKLLFYDVAAGSVGLLIALNMAVFSLAALGMSFFVASVLKSKSATHAVANVVGLGFGFISGAIVPQAMLGPSVLLLASFTPAYWFVKANNLIFTAVHFDWASLSPVFACMGIELAFAAVFFAVTQVYVRYKADTSSR